MAVAPFLPPDTETPAGPHCTARWQAHFAAVVTLAIAVVLEVVRFPRDIRTILAAVAAAAAFGGLRAYFHIRDHL